MSYRPYQVIINAAAGASSAITIELQNSTGSAIGALIPVTIGSDGKLKTVDVSSDTDAIKNVAVTVASIADGDHGSVVLAGKIANISTSFDFGDYVFVSKTGDLTNVVPEIGVGGFVEGDAHIRIGVITRNRDNPANKDLLVKIEAVGVL